MAAVATFRRARLSSGGGSAMDASVAQSETVEAPPSGWALTYDGFDPATEGARETLCALGNGYFETRGAAPWATADGVHYPGAYLAGGYNRLRTAIAGRDVENEGLVNLPNWLSLQLDLGGAGWFDERAVRLLSYRQQLDLRFGMLLRTLTFEDAEGRRSTLRERRLVSMADKHLAGLELTVTAENCSGAVTVRSGVDGRVLNQGAKLYALFNNRHLEPLAGETVGADGVLLLVRTTASNLHVAQAARTRLLRGDATIEAERQAIFEPGYAGQQFETAIAQGETLRIEKMAVLYSSRDAAIAEPVTAARKALGRLGSFPSAYAAHALRWTQFWGRFDIRLKPAERPPRLNVPMLLRLNLFHLLQTASTNSIGLDIGVPARGWTGEAYEGHVFWDELFIFPTLTFRLPEISRSLLMYRYRRLGEARAAAAQAGHQGAMFPWQSGSDGQEETQDLNLNPRSGRWVPDNSFRQRHVGSAIVWNVWNYVQITGDHEFLQFYGAELILEIARFWASMATYNETRGRYEIHGVMGPDEFHEGYPGAPIGGLRNNAYTNVMAAWVMCRALDVLERLPRARLAELRERLGITDGEVRRWDDISRRMFVPFRADGMISQFEGYDELAELDWDAYRRRYGDIQRLELILEAEGDSANRYKVSKQADVLMLFYLFTSDQLGRLFARLGYEFKHEMITPTVVYYDSRCTHGSTLSRVVAAWVLARSHRPKAMAYLAEALLSDVNDIQGGTAAEGVHLGAMAGTLDLVQRVCTGVEVGDGVLRLNPELPDTLAELDLCIRYHGHMLNMTLTREALTVRGREAGPAPIRLAVRGDERLLEACGTHTFRLS
jgi:trehalose/maltose hydrolase-like predicted phosphorylase